MVSPLSVISKGTGCSPKSPMIRETKYEGEDQLLFGRFLAGSLLSHWPYGRPEKSDDLHYPFTIKTNEKTKLLLISKSIAEEIRETISDITDRYLKFLCRLECIGNIRFSF